MAVVLSKVKDKATGQLNAGISAATLSIPLKSGEGASFPQPYTGAASSAGSATVLNDTGDLAGLAVGDFVRNVTDGSWAFVVTAGTNSVTTTRLKGGTDNTWDSGDTWRSGEFVVTLATINASGVDTAYEEVLISNRSTDTLTVPSGGRGYNGTTAQSFSADDYVQLRVTAPNLEEVKSLLKELNQTVDTTTSNVTTAQADIDSIESNATFYVAAAGSSNAFTGTLAAMPAAYTTGERLYFKANHTITGSATFNRAGLGAKTIKKLDGATNLASGDIVSGQIVEVVYDGTNYLMQSPLGQSLQDADVLFVGTADSAEITNTTDETNFDTNTVTLTSAQMTQGACFEVIAGLAWDAVTGAISDLYVKLGSTKVLTWRIQPGGGTLSAQLFVHAFITVRSTGGSGAVHGMGSVVIGDAIDNSITDDVDADVPRGAAGTTAASTTTIDTTTSQTLQMALNMGGAASATNKARLLGLVVKRLAVN